MKAVFADTGYWIALFNPRDRLHRRAIEVSQQLLGRPLVTSQMVFVEFLNYCAGLGSPFRQRAVQAVRGLQQGVELYVVPQSAELFGAALNLYERRPDKAWSLTDCASILLMQERGLTEALAHDDHFQQAGFLPLLRDL